MGLFHAAGPDRDRGGGANVYGFANGDPVNFVDPFGLEVVVVGQRAQDAVRIAYRESPLFRRPFDALDNRRANEVLIIIKFAETPQEKALLSSTDLGAAGWFPNSKNRRSGLILLNDEEWMTAMLISQKVTHELAHAAGSNSEITGVPAGCAAPDNVSPCANRQADKMDAERYPDGNLSRTEERAIRQGAAIDARYRSRAGARP